MFVLLVTFSFVFQGVLAEQKEDLNDDRKFLMEQLRILSEENCSEVNSRYDVLSMNGCIYYRKNPLKAHHKTTKQVNTKWRTMCITQMTSSFLSKAKADLGIRVKLIKSTTSRSQESGHSQAEKKRLILDHDQSNLDPVLNQITTVGTAPVGSTYVRWGRTTCPDGAELVYNGFIGGSTYSSSGGGANQICLHSQPEWGHYVDGVQGGAYVYGTEYEFGVVYSNGGSDFFAGKNLYQEDVPCAVCYVPRSSNIMIPSRLTCPDSSWHKEYSGYLVAERHTHYRSEHVCLDTDPEKMQAGFENHDGHLIYLVEGVCGSLKCPPYVNGRELTCVVCSKQHRNNVHEH